MSRLRPAAVLLALCVVPLAAAACGGSRSGDQVATTTVTRTVVVTQPATTADQTTTTTSTTTTTTTTASAPRCTTGDLAAASGPGQAGVGHRSTIYILTNRSGADCRLTGYAGMAFLDGSGKTLRNSVVRGSAYLFTDPGPKPIVLAPGESASYALGWTVANGRSCATSSSAELTPPDETSYLTLDSQITICPGEDLKVSAFVPGTSGP